MEHVSRENDSDIVLAFDFPFEKPENRQILLKKAKSVLEEVHPYICAVKFNHHLILPLGTFDGVQELLKAAHEKGLETIMDCKANDIGATNGVIAIKAKNHHAVERLKELVYEQCPCTPEAHLAVMNADEAEMASKLAREFEAKLGFKHVRSITSVAPSRRTADRGYWPWHSLCDVSG
jgi:hypothetical protein